MENVVVEVLENAIELEETESTWWAVAGGNWVVCGG